MKAYRVVFDPEAVDHLEASFLNVRVRTGPPFAIDWLPLALSNRATIGDADGSILDVLRAA